MIEQKRSGLGWPVTLRKKVVKEYMDDKTTSYPKLSRKYDVPAATIQHWIQRFGIPRSRTHWKKYAGPPASEIDKALWLISLGVPKAEAARRTGVSIKRIYKNLKKGNPYEHQ